MKKMGNEPKYVIQATIKTDGVVVRKDVVGAIFGQTEGLLGEELQLRKLQRTGRIGHIDVELESKRGKIHGEIKLPSSIDQVSTAVIAAALETIDRIGPCKATIKVKSIENTRDEKRSVVIDRAKELLLNIVEGASSESQNILEEVRSVLTAGTETDYKGMTCGPNAINSEGIIIVEGRNDVRNLLKFGIKNSIAMMGAGVLEDLVTLAKKKTTVTAFLDGDRGGSLLLMELEGALGNSLTHVATAPQSREVEHLEGKVITKCLNQKEVAKKAVGRVNAELKKADEDYGGKKSKVEDITIIVPDRVREWAGALDDLETNHALIVLEDGTMTEAVGAGKLGKTAESTEGAVGIVFKGKVSERILKIAKDASISEVLATSVGEKHKLGNVQAFVPSDF
jgi:DNA primase